MNDEKIIKIINKYLDSTEVKLQLPFMTYVLNHVVKSFQEDIVEGKMLLEDFLVDRAKNYDSEYYLTERGIEKIYNTYGVNMGAVLSEDKDTEYDILNDKEFKKYNFINSDSLYLRSLVIDYAYRHVLRDTLAYIKFQKVLHKQN